MKLPETEDSKSAKSPEHILRETYRAMKNRCYRLSNKRYEHYGGRGITVCDRWLRSYENFRDDMGHRPPGRTLDRIDNDGNYCPENCRWATHLEQARNTSRNAWLAWNGKTQTYTEWSRELGIPLTTIYYRLSRGLSWEQVLSPGRVDSRCVWITWNGRTQNASQWAKELGITHHTIIRRAASNLPLGKSTR